VHEPASQTAKQTGAETQTVRVDAQWQQDKARETTAIPFATPYSKRAQRSNKKSALKTISVQLTGGFGAY
jgi:hypothetical protein